MYSALSRATLLYGSAWKPQETAGDTAGDRRLPQEGPKETAGEQNIKCDAKFYVKLAAHGKANVGLYSDIWSFIDS